ncbi:MAG: type II toxin-antitoxin system HicA family toxin [Methylococcaceae bacterium]
MRWPHNVGFASRSQPTRSCSCIRIVGGWQVARQSGSHVIMVKESEMTTLSIPDHREVAKGTLRSLIRAAGITVNEFIART